VHVAHLITRAHWEQVCLFGGVTMWIGSHMSSWNHAFRCIIEYEKMGRSPCCSKVGLLKGPWTAREDILLTTYIEYHGQGDWRKLPQRAGLRRCGKSCRLRWLNYLRPNIKRGNISPDEDDLIIRLHRLLGNRWSLIAGRLPGRTDNEIKNYWNSHLSKKLRKTGIDPLTHKPLQHHYNNINPTHDHQDIMQAAEHIQQNSNVKITHSASTITVNGGPVLYDDDRNNSESAAMDEMLDNRMDNLEEFLPNSNACDDQHKIFRWMQHCYNDDDDEEEYNGFDSVELQNVFQEYSGLLEKDRSLDLDDRNVQLGECAIRGQGD
ncbi:hypothetical protein KI387_010937, partial [Taxus chinensis]